MYSKIIFWVMVEYSWPQTRCEKFVVEDYTCTSPPSSPGDLPPSNACDGVQDQSTQISEPDTDVEVSEGNTVPTSCAG